MSNEQKDRICFSAPWSETYYMCRHHFVPYPKGAKCPVCAKAEKENDKKEV